MFGLDGKWIAGELRAQAELLGATVVDRSSVIITHLSEAVRPHASRLLGREDVAALTQSLKRSHPVVVEDLTPALLTLGEIQRVLHALLDEGVPIRDLVRIYEALSLAAKGGTDPDRLIEAARAALGPAIVAPYAVDGRLDVLTLEPRCSRRCSNPSVRPTAACSCWSTRPRRGARHRRPAPAPRAVRVGHRPVLVCPAGLRLPLHRMVRIAVPDLPILSYPELAGTTAQIESAGVITDVRDAVR